MADRIAVMSYRSEIVKKDMIVKMTRPRNPTSPEFNDLKRELSKLLMSEQMRFEKAHMGVTGD